MQNVNFSHSLSLLYHVAYQYYSETEYELQKLEKGFKDVGREQTKEISELKQKVCLLFSFFSVLSLKFMHQKSTSAVTYLHCPSIFCCYGRFSPLQGSAAPFHIKFLRDLVNLLPVLMRSGQLILYRA